MSGETVVFIGDQMAPVIAGVVAVEERIGQSPVVVGGLAVLARLSRPYRATTDLDIVDRLRGALPQLEVLRSSQGAKTVAPSAVELPTPYGVVRVDVLEVRQGEIDEPSDDPGDRLHAAAHAWAYDSATDVRLQARGNGEVVTVTTRVAEPGPLVAMKLQAIMNRGVAKQGTDLLDIIQLTLDESAGPFVSAQIAAADAAIAADIATHVDLMFVRRRGRTLDWIRRTGNDVLTLDDLDLVAELLLNAAGRQ